MTADKNKTLLKIKRRYGGWEATARALYEMLLEAQPAYAEILSSVAEIPNPNAKIGRPHSAHKTASVMFAIWDIQAQAVLEGKRLRPSAALRKIYPYGTKGPDYHTVSNAYRTHLKRLGEILESNFSFCTAKDVEEE